MGELVKYYLICIVQGNQDKKPLLAKKNNSPGIPATLVANPIWPCGMD